MESKPRLGGQTLSLMRCLFSGHNLLKIESEQIFMTLKVFIGDRCHGGENVAVLEIQTEQFRNKC